MKNGEGCDCAFSDSTVSHKSKTEQHLGSHEESELIPARLNATTLEIILKGFSAFSGCAICSLSVWFHPYDVYEFVNIVKF